MRRGPALTETSRVLTETRPRIRAGLGPQWPVPLGPPPSPVPVLLSEHWLACHARPHSFPPCVCSLRCAGRDAWWSAGLACERALYSRVVLAETGPAASRCRSFSLQNANSCPVDRTVFKCICIRAHFNGKILRKVSVDTMAEAQPALSLRPFSLSLSLGKTSFQKLTCFSVMSKER